MTPKQRERLENKIKKIKAAMTYERKMWGGYHDGGGLRYAPPEIYIKLEDYSGALRYYNWFHKNFSDDSAYSVFFLEWAFVLFQRKKTAEAGKKIYASYLDNPHVIHKFFGKELPLEKTGDVTADWKVEAANHLTYSATDEKFNTFASWLNVFISSDSFIENTNQYAELEKASHAAPVGTERSRLFDKLYRFREELTQ